MPIMVSEALEVFGSSKKRTPDLLHCLLLLVLRCSALQVKVLGSFTFLETFAPARSWLPHTLLLSVQGSQ